MKTLHGSKKHVVVILLVPEVASHLRRRTQDMLLEVIAMASIDKAYAAVGTGSPAGGPHWQMLYLLHVHPFF